MIHRRVVWGILLHRSGMRRAYRGRPPIATDNRSSRFSCTAAGIDALGLDTLLQNCKNAVHYVKKIDILFVAPFGRQPSTPRIFDIKCF